MHEDNGFMHIYLTRALTGHERFIEYLHMFRRADDVEAEEDDALHNLFCCER